ncbi:hypothetical protein [Parasitella parasitica]|uniref:Uncharacterized protein n=1 Tax=Parasitella parasitica TaxID=35722 RepID=A0A0B7MZL9_9FUNG|nr:hypothetical protein [Parasitella parasitica]
MGRRSDIIISTTNGLEFGCGEASLSDDDFDTKNIVDLGLKTPKIMHDMFVQLSVAVQNRPEEVKNLQVIGLVFSRFKLRMLVMDCPKGYVCRLRCTRTEAFSGREEFLGEEFNQVYSLIWRAKEICKETERVIGSFKNKITDDFADEDIDRILLPDSLHSPSRN